MHDVELTDLTELLHRQYGALTTAQAKGVGLSPERIRQRVTTGVWQRLCRGVYRHVLFPRTWRSDLMAAVLATGGIGSHRSAARLHRFESLGRGALPEVVVAHGRWRRLEFATVHQSTQMDRADATEVNGIPCTGPGRTVLDLGVSMRPRQLGRVIDDLLRRKLITLAELWDVLVRHSVQGRAGAGPLRVALELRRGQERIALSEWSYMIANLLESAGLPRPRLEFRAHAPDGRFLGQLDLAYPDAMLAIELDSVGWHNNLESFQSDRSRARQLTVAGWSVLQFTWDDYTKRPDQLIAQTSGILRRVAVVGQR